LASPEPPHIESAGRYLPTLVTLTLVFGDAGLLLITVAMIGDAVAGLSAFISLRTMGLVGCSLLVAAGGFAPAAMLAYARQLALEGPGAKPRDGDWLAGWPQALVTATFGLLAAGGVAWLWGLPAGPAPDPSSMLVAGGALVLAAFPVLVLERSYANADERALPEAPHLQWLLRVPLAALLGLGIGTALRSAGLGWPIWIEQAVAVLILAVAAELILRAGATLFLPLPPLAEARSVARSTLARVVRLDVPNLKSVSVIVERQFGIDLSRSWALGFIARAAFPVAFGLAVVGWGLTGVTALPLDERAVYQRLGVPVDVLGPGLHVRLPWPFGILRRVELGVLHEVPVTLADPTQASGVESEQPSGPIALPNAEAPAPPSADRLWDQSHPGEAAYLVASPSHSQQGFQSVAVDLRLIYRVGLSDQAAMQAAYQVDDPDRLVRAAAGRRLASYFASHTLLGVLGANRETFTAEFRGALQSELDRLSTGIEVVAVVVEAIHPPPGAANAYHNVQAAEINSKVSVADETGAAAQRTREAARDATQARNEATAQAAETLAQAEADRLLFQADNEAYRHGGKAFLLERWFDRIKGALGRTQLVLVDHRLNGADAPTIDLRSFVPPGASTP